MCSRCVRTVARDSPSTPAASLLESPFAMSRRISISRSVSGRVGGSSRIPGGGDIGCAAGECGPDDVSIRRPLSRLELLLEDLRLVLDDHHLDLRGGCGGPLGCSSPAWTDSTMRVPRPAAEDISSIPWTLLARSRMLA